MLRLRRPLKLAFKILFTLSILGAHARAAIPEKEILSAIGEKLNRLQTASEWKEFVKTRTDAFPPLKDGSSVFVDKMTLNVDDDTFTLGVGFRQVFLKADLERVKKILNSPEIWKQLYGLDADANVGKSADGFKARIFKKVPVISDQDYVLDYRNFEEGGIWFQRAKQAEDKKEFALRDNIKAIEKVEGGVIYREYSIVYILRWYLRALGPQVRSVMEKELAKINVAVKCAAESAKPVSAELGAECWKIADKTK